jgi:sRNA-binding regulator protein Hfq
MNKICRIFYGRAITLTRAKSRRRLRKPMRKLEAHTRMVIVLNDGEKIEGTIEWYDLDVLKINRPNEPNLLLLKHNIKYMFKAENKK